MTKDYNSNTGSATRNPRYSSDNKDRRNQSNYRKPNPPRHNYTKKNYSKSNIFLKATVYSLGIVLSVLVLAFFIIKQNKNFSLITKCPATESIKISNKIQQIVNSDSNLVVLTQNEKGKQEIIKLDNCLNEISRNKFVK